jgi:YD repeat-containing protein
MTARIQTMITDASGVSFDPESLAHAYTYDANGNMLTDTCVDGSGLTRVKTYTYTEINTAFFIASETRWIVQ